MSSPPFDPYHKWLGISPQDQPPNHYRLLGIDLLESDLDVIDLAASRQINHVRSLILGDHPGLTQRLLNELSVARICLLNDAHKAQYDSDLRARIEATPVPAEESASDPLPDPPPDPPVQPVDQTASPLPAEPLAPTKRFPQLRQLLEHPFAPPTWLAFLLILIAAAGFFYPRVDGRNGKGVVILKSNTPNPKLVVDGIDKKVEWNPDGTEACIDDLLVGKHKIAFKNEEGFEAPAVTIDVERDGRTVLLANLQRSIPSPVPVPVGKPNVPGPFDARKLQAEWTKHLGVPPEPLINSIDMKLILIPPGEFIMGSPKIETELPHLVRISYPFYLGAYEVTQAEYQKLMLGPLGNGKEPLAEIDAGNHPVVNVSWDEAVQFCNRLSDQEGLKPCYQLDGEAGCVALPSGTGYRLPTEAEWEFACRAGTATQVVGQMKANPFGLFDLCGNVREWCQDFFAADYYSKSPRTDPPGPSSERFRVNRGGRYLDDEVACHSAIRRASAPADRSSDLGFRVVRVTTASIMSQPRIPIIQPRADVPPPSFEDQFDAKQARARQKDWADHLGVPITQINSIGMTLMLIPAGEFMMGSPDNEEGRNSYESSQHRVRITWPFFLGAYEVTQYEYYQIMGSNPSAFSAKEHARLIDQDTGRYPVENVSWDDAVQFCNELSEREQLDPCYEQNVDAEWITMPSGTGYRLPTEAEWEFACRAGSVTRFSFGDSFGRKEAVLDQYGWFNKKSNRSPNSNRSPRPVGLKSSNEFGLFDMHGNIEEWCQDFYAGNYDVALAVNPVGPKLGPNRVARGGSWDDPLVSCRSACRNKSAPDDTNDHKGFRVVRVVPIK